MEDIAETTVLCLSPKASFQSLGQGAVVLMIDSGQLYTCNETTEAFLKLVDGQRPFGAIIDELIAEFVVQRQTAAADFLAVARELRSEGILDIRQAAP